MGDVLKQIILWPLVKRIAGYIMLIGMGTPISLERVGKIISIEIRNL